MTRKTQPVSPQKLVQTLSLKNLESLFRAKYGVRKVELVSLKVGTTEYLGKSLKSIKIIKTKTK